MASKKIFFFNDMENIKNEAKKYIYNKKENRNTGDVPRDKYNHLMDALRYVVAKLPQDPNDMGGIYVRETFAKPLSVFVESFKDESEERVSYGRKGIYTGIRKL